MCLKLFRRQNLASIFDKGFLAIVVLAWRNERALVAPTVVDEITLKVHCSLCQPLKALLLEQFPHFLLGDVVALLD